MKFNFKLFLRQVFLVDNRYVLYLCVAFVVTLLLLVAPSMSIDLGNISTGKKIEYTGPQINIDPLNIHSVLNIKPSGIFSKRNIITFKVEERTNRGDFDYIIKTVTDRLSFLDRHDYIISSDYSKKEIYIDAGSEITPSFLSMTVATSGDFEILKYDASKSEDQYGFILRSSYEDIGIKRQNITQVTKLALEDEADGDPASKYDIRITLDQNSSDIIQSDTSASKAYGVFDGEQFVGFLQLFVKNQYIVSSLTKGDDFYSIYGRFNSPVLKIYPEYVSSTEQNPKVDFKFFEAISYEYIFVFLLVTITVLLLYKYEGFVTMLSVAMSTLPALFIIKFESLYVSEFTVLGFIFGGGLSLLVLLMNNLSIVGKIKRFDYSVLVILLTALVSYLGSKLLPGVESMFFVPIMFISLATGVVLLTTNAILIKPVSENGKARFKISEN